ncbi:MAG: trypsin-like peptidase domain-containing protein [Desulfatibacillaceae bacterium]|nr:trypsin-like peptidase domain-containing protein [Desulfatibacillaceae bacterium]
MKARFLKALAAALVLFAVHAPCLWAFLPEERINIGIYNHTYRGVVNITTTVVTYDFFLRAYPREGAGSGIVLDKEGHILTNNHVITNARSLEVTLWDQSKYPAVLRGVYPESDIAVIKIDAPAEKLFPLTLGESTELVVGQKVWAIGNPFGLGVTLTTGVLSSLGRSVAAPGGNLMEDLIQTDASINPGNSGGPLISSMGWVIGVNTAILSPSGGSVGIGFAVPVDEVKRVVPEIIEKGFVSYPYIGVLVFPLNLEIASFLGLDTEYGLLITEIADKSPAKQAGLMGPKKRLRIGNSVLPVGGDVILQMGETKMEGSDAFVRAMRKFKPGQEITVRILRDGSQQDITVTLGERPRRP